MCNYRDVPLLVCLVYNCKDVALLVQLDVSLMLSASQWNYRQSKAFRLSCLSAMIT